MSSILSADSQNVPVICDTIQRDGALARSRWGECLVHLSKVVWALASQEDFCAFGDEVVQGNQDVVQVVHGPVIVGCVQQGPQAPHSGGDLQHANDMCSHTFTQMTDACVMIVGCVQQGPQAPHPGGDLQHTNDTCSHTCICHELSARTIFHVDHDHVDQQGLQAPHPG